jgi:electron transfer flavoprotein beta subunit
VIAGVESTDGSTGVVPQMVAALLDVPSASFAKSLEVKDGILHINRQTEKGYDVVECPLPAVVTVTAGVNEPRYPSFKGIVEAKKKPVDHHGLTELEVVLDGGSASQTVDQINEAPHRAAGEIVEDDGSGAAKIADFLSTAKVI